MKKIILSVCLLLCASFVQAREVVTIVFAFGVGDSVANYGRTLADEANNIQDQYTFVFDAKPGAGGSIAANYVDNNFKNSILQTSAAFFVRPNFYLADSHRVDRFQSLMIQCSAPMAIGSIKYSSLKDISANAPVTIGITGLGATSHLIASQLKQKFPNLLFVPYKSPSDAIIALAGGEIDMSVGFLSEFKEWRGNNGTKKINVLGITGARSVDGEPTLSSQGLKLVDQMNNPQQLIISNRVSAEQRDQWFKILSTAAQSPRVQQAYSQDKCIPSQLNSQQNINMFGEQQDFWKKISSKIDITQK